MTTPPDALLALPHPALPTDYTFRGDRFSKHDYFLGHQMQAYARANLAPVVAERNRLDREHDAALIERDQMRANLAVVIAERDAQEARVIALEAEISEHGQRAAILLARAEAAEAQNEKLVERIELHHDRATFAEAENAKLREALEKIASETAATWVSDTALAALNASAAKGVGS